MNRLLNLAKNIIITNLADLEYPYRFTFILTHKCQFRCSMCNIWKKHAENELTLEEIGKFFEKSNKFSWINLSGGEISLREDIYEIIEVIFKHCKNLYILDFPTNGFRTEQIVDIVKRILTSHNPKKLLVTVSLDGPPQTHDEIRGMPGSWDRAVETFAQLRKLRNSKFNVFFGMTLQSSNMTKFHETFESANKRLENVRYGDFHINLIQYSRHYYNNIENAGSEDRQKLREQVSFITGLRRDYLDDAIGFLEKRYHHLAEIYLCKKQTPIPCQALSASFFMDPAGNVYPCSIYDKILGNIKDYDYNIYKLWSSISRNESRKEILKGNCPQCWTPCEAYQSILANLLPKFRRGKFD